MNELAHTPLFDLATRRSTMRIVDAHHHLWSMDLHPWLSEDIGPSFFGNPEPIQRDYLLKDFLRDAAQVDLAKSVAIEADYDSREPAGETRWLQSFADSDASRGFPHAIVGFADLTNDTVESLLDDHCQYPNFRGIRQKLNRHPNPLLNMAHYDYLTDRTWSANLDALETRRLSFDLQIYSHQAEAAAAIALKHPGLGIVVDHALMPTGRDRDTIDQWRDGLHHLAKCENVCIKISGLGMFDHDWTPATFKEIIAPVIETFGVHRCMFASNFPVDSLTSSYGELWDAFALAIEDYSDADRCELFAGTAERFYRI